MTSTETEFSRGGSSSSADQIYFTSQAPRSRGASWFSKIERNCEPTNLDLFGSAPVLLGSVYGLEKCNGYFDLARVGYSYKSTGQNPF